MADMGDLSSKINNILNSPEGMQQLQSMASALGLGNMMGGDASSTAASPPQPNPFPNNQQGQSQGNSFQNNQQSQPQGNSFQNNQQGQPQGNSFQNNQQGQPQGNSFQNNQQDSPPQGGMPQGLNLDAIMGMLQNMGMGGAGGTPSGGTSGAPSGMPNIDLNMIMKIQQAMSAFAMGNKNVDLLRALRPHLSEARAKKVDDAVRIMQLINMLPLIKESGIFGIGGENR